MKELFLHYLWQTRQFDQNHLVTTTGQPLHILNWGIINYHGGPDFKQGKIKIGQVTWAGQIEHHVKASDWYQHQHQKDDAYDQVILHVVYEEDQPVYRSNGERIPCLELKGRIPIGLSRRYQRLSQQAGWVPCERHLSTIQEITRKVWLDRILVERLERKTQVIADLLEENQYDWEQTFYQWLASGFGLKVNAEPFLQLARSIPLRVLQRHRDNLFQLEAILFGQAGLLEKSFTDDYPQRLKKEYSFLREKYNFHPLLAHAWNFGRMRPANFPTIRIAQFAVLIYQSAHLFSKALAAKNLKELEHMFELKISHYWLRHYVFDKTTQYRHKSLGRSTIHLLAINRIIPILFFYGKYKKEEAYQQKALDLLEAIPAEQNQILNRWKALGMSPDNAYQTQALLELKKTYCDQQACLRCAIGHQILRNGA